MLKLLSLTLMVFVLASCTTPPQKFNIKNEEQSLVWPSSGEVARYSYVGELDGEVLEDTSFKKDWWGWIVGLVQGQSQPLKMKRPYHVYVDQQGKIYVADLGLPGVFVFNTQDKTLEVWKSLNGHQALAAPVSIIEVNGEIWVADADLARIVRFDKQGNILGRVGEGQLTRPLGLAYDQANQIVYIVDSQQHKIKLFTSKGLFIREIGKRGEGLGEFNFPTAISFKQGLIYISDSMNARVQVIDPNGEVKSVFGYRGLNVGNTPRPKGIAVDSDDNVYIVESYYGYLLVYDKSGRFLLPISAKNSAIGDFYLPAGVTLDHNDRVYLADMFNGRVVMFQYLGAE